MISFFVIQIILSLALVAIILIQKSGTDGLSGLGNSSSGLVSGRAKAGFISKLTAIIALLFMLNSLLLGSMVVRENNKKIIIEDSTEISPEGYKKSTVPNKKAAEEEVPIAD